MISDRSMMRIINKKITRIAKDMEKLNMLDQMQLLEKPGRFFYLNFMSGMIRGLGMAIGFTILGALILYILQSVVKANLPVIGRFIAEIVRIVEDSRR